MVIVYQQVINGYQHLSRVVNGYQSVINGYQWLLVINKLSLVINGYQKLLMVNNGNQRLLIVVSQLSIVSIVIGFQQVIIGCQWLSRVINVY